MLHGIIAASCAAPSAGGSGANPYPDALFYLNFASQDYFVGATRYVAADIIDNPSRIITGGLYLGAGASQLIGDALAACVREYMTVVVEYDRTSDGSFTSAWRTGFTVGNTVEESIFQAYTGYTTYEAQEYGSSWSNNVYLDTFAAGTGDYTPSHVRQAVTRTSGKLAISGNGLAVATATGATGTLNVNAAVLGGDYFDSAGFDGFIRKLILFAPRDDADLPGLSTIS